MMFSAVALISPNLCLHEAAALPFFEIHLRKSSKRSSKLFTKPRSSSIVIHDERSFQCSSANYNIYQTDPDDNLASCVDTYRINYSVDCDNLGNLIRGCSSIKELRKLHTVVAKCEGRSRMFLDHNLISSYVRIGDLTVARKVFDQMPKRNVVSWTAMLSGYSMSGFEDEALSLYMSFIESGVQANCKTFVCLLNLCSRRLDFELGRQLHGCVIKGNFGNLIVESAVVYLYAQCGLVDEVFRMFDRMQERDVVCWTTIISACSQLGESGEVFTLFLRMLSEGFTPNEFTVCSVLKACGEKKVLRFGRQLHGSIVKKILADDVSLWTTLVDMYAKCGRIEDSKIVFDGMRRRNMVTWTSMIAGYARNGHGEEAINLFRVMQRHKMYANKMTMVSIIRACGLIRSLKTGKEVHAQILKNQAQDNVYLGSTLIWLYCKCRDYSSANNVLQRMTYKDVVSWTAMISGCARSGHEYEALEFLKEMVGEGVAPNPFTYSSALKVCAKLENVWHGKLIHSSIYKTRALSNVFVGSALINMYVKCGYVDDAIGVFDSMPKTNRVSWKAMILGYAENGLCREAMMLMYEMAAKGIEVEDYILATVLTACADFEWSAEDHPPEYSLQSKLIPDLKKEAV